MVYSEQNETITTSLEKHFCEPLVAAFWQCSGLIEWSFTADNLRAAFYQIDSVSIVWAAIALFLQQVSYLPVALEIAHAFLGSFIDCSLGVLDDVHEF